MRLLPCPFCGGAAEMIAVPRSALVRCTSCGASTDWYRRPRIAVAVGKLDETDMAAGAWNSRAAAPNEENRP